MIPFFFDQKKKNPKKLALHQKIGITHNRTRGWLGVRKAPKGRMIFIINQSWLLFWTQSLWTLS